MSLQQRETNFPPLMTLEEVAKVMRISKVTASKWRSAGGHPLLNDLAIRDGSRVLFRGEDVEDWVANLSYEYPALAQKHKKEGN